jgi:hypothetical protein
VCRMRPVATIQRQSATYRCYLQCSCKVQSAQWRIRVVMQAPGAYGCKPISSGNTLLKSASISIGFIVSRGRARLCRRAGYD